MLSIPMGFGLLRFKIVCYRVANNPRSSVVAIHGIGAHGERTWVARNGVNWLKDPNMLPELLPTARILQFSYESTWLGAESIDQRCSLIADQLLYCLSAARMVRSLVVNIEKCANLFANKELSKKTHNFHCTLFWWNSSGKGYYQAMPDVIIKDTDLHRP